MAQAETERLTEILCGAALSRAVCTIAELGIADQIEPGSPQAVESLAEAIGTHARSFQLRRVSTLRGVFEYGVWKDATPGPSAGSTRWELKRS
jgi:hypothetical protein